ncbi:MAG TPA: hypothetical protein VIJ12_07705 [Candidatus Baltobacteraceae bacterium]
MGEFEHTVLLALIRLGEGAYGAPIRQEIEVQTGRSPAIGAVHATLARLERKGLVRSWIGAPTPERGGKAKRHFKVEPLGLEAVRQARTALERLQSGLAIRARFA